MLLTIAFVLIFILVALRREEEVKGMLEEMEQRERFADFADVMCYVGMLYADAYHGLHRVIIVVLHPKVNNEPIQFRISKYIVVPSGNLGIGRKASGFAVLLPSSMGLGANILPAMFIDQSHKLCNVIHWSRH